MKIKPITKGNLQTVLDSDWFRAVGTLKPDARYRSLRTWAEAVKHAKAIAWENLCLEAANNYRCRLLERDIKRYNQWNKVVEKVKADLMPLVETKIDAYSAEERMPKEIAGTIRWDILHFCMECEYDDVFPVGFFAAQMFWYTQGHFPCGWEGGKFPKGRRIVF